MNTPDQVVVAGPQGVAPLVLAELVERPEVVVVVVAAA